jgi:2,4-dienoyl-CoA reductase-like NADH-dependent reductase (Old Yellow Enzyme family)
MSALLNSYNLGGLAVKNRFICSACEDATAAATGEVPDRTVQKTQALSEGETGLIITAQMFVHPLGRTRAGQIGIHCHAMIPGLRRLVESAHRSQGKIVFQLGHAGAQGSAKIIGRASLGPSADMPMSQDEIHEVIEVFLKTAKRAVEAGGAAEPPSRRFYFGPQSFRFLRNPLPWFP